MTTAIVRPRPPRCARSCGVASRYAEHHDRLLALDVDPEVLLELFEIAVTWHELDYSEAGVLGPERWWAFVQAHSWTDPERAERAAGLALDVARRSGPVRATPWPDEPIAPVIELVRT